MDEAVRNGCRCPSNAGWNVARHKLLAAPLTIVLVLLFVASAGHFHGMPQTNRDYAALGKLMSARLKANDVIFVLPGRWYVTPFFYYVDQSRLVSGNFETYSAKPNARIWVVLFENEQPAQMMSDALAGFSVSEQVNALRSQALLYERR